jgi:hypothetical protein
MPEHLPPNTGRACFLLEVFWGCIFDMAQGASKDVYLAIHYFFTKYVGHMKSLPDRYICKYSECLAE